MSPATIAFEILGVCYKRMFYLHAQIHRKLSSHWRYLGIKFILVRSWVRYHSLNGSMVLKRTFVNVWLLSVWSLSLSCGCFTPQQKVM